jgi:hypothetical protein
MASGVNTAELDLIEGPEVRIHLPPAESRANFRLKAINSNCSNGRANK